MTLSLHYGKIPIDRINNIERFKLPIQITSDEILKKYNWERFCDIVSDSIDIQQDAYELTFEQAVKCGFIGLPKYYCVYQSYYDFQGDYVNEFIGDYKEE